MTYGDVVGEYGFDPESKSVDATGAPCGRQTIGQLQRRHVAIGGVRHIGKEPNRLEDVLDGSVTAPDEVYTEYVDPKRDKLTNPLRSASIREIARKTGLARSTLQRLLNRNATPHVT